MEFREDFPLLLNQKGLTNIGVEVGVCKGEYANQILRFWKGKKLYLVDTWRHLEGIVDINNPDHNGHLDNMAKTFMAMYQHEGRAVMIREYSADAANLFRDQSLDFVYIDATHDFVNVTADLKAWTPKVRPGGIIAGHDYVDAPYDISHCSVFEVKSAVDKFFEGKVLNVSKELQFPTWWVEL